MFIEIEIDEGAVGFSCPECDVYFELPEVRNFLPVHSDQWGAAKCSLSEAELLFKVRENPGSGVSGIKDYSDRGMEKRRKRKGRPWSVVLSKTNRIQCPVCTEIMPPRDDNRMPEHQNRRNKRFLCITSNFEIKYIEGPFAKRRKPKSKGSGRHSVQYVAPWYSVTQGGSPGLGRKH